MLFSIGNFSVLGFGLSSSYWLNRGAVSKPDLIRMPTFWSINLEEDPPLEDQLYKKETAFVRDVIFEKKENFFWWSNPAFFLGDLPGISKKRDFIQVRRPTSYRICSQQKAKELLGTLSISIALCALAAFKSKGWRSVYIAGALPGYFFATNEVLKLETLNVLEEPSFLVERRGGSPALRENLETGKLMIEKTSDFRSLNFLARDFAVKEMSNEDYIALFDRISRETSKIEFHAKSLLDHLESLKKSSFKVGRCGNMALYAFHISKLSENQRVFVCAFLDHEFLMITDRNQKNAVFCDPWNGTYSDRKEDIIGVFGEVLKNGRFYPAVHIPQDDHRLSIVEITQGLDRIAEWIPEEKAFKDL